jgi:hypothetical protein
MNAYDIRDALIKAMRELGHTAVFWNEESLQVRVVTADGAVFDIAVMEVAP